MSVKTYSRRQDGDKALSAHFRVREFACKDGSDAVLISEELIEKLEQLRAMLGCRITVNSGYRTAAHNQKVGGSKTSKHCKGLAADIFCKRDGRTVSAKEVCRAAQDLGFPGIGYISSAATHVDVRESGRFWVDESRSNIAVADFYRYFPPDTPYAMPTDTVKRGSTGEGVRWVQERLTRAGFPVTVDGRCGKATEAAIKAYQKAHGLTVDGRVGRKTRTALAKE